MDATLITAIVAAIGGTIVTPIVGVAVLWINQKFNSEVVALKLRLQSCEDKWEAHGKEKS